MILHPYPPGYLAIPQSAHALLAFQLADHWGNRATPRPAPRPDVLAAVLLHDAGWDGREEPPRLALDGLPLAFDTLPDEEREELWRAAIERAGLRGRYVAYLVSYHVCTLAGVYSEHPHPGFLASEEARRADIRSQLAADPRYAQVLSGPVDEVNRAVLRLSDALAVHLSRGTTRRVELTGLCRRGGCVSLTLEHVRERIYRLHPWPLSGTRLDLHAEGRILEDPVFPDGAALRHAWATASVQRLQWTVLAPGTAESV
jgi:Protein of unknown function (DUF3891)